MRRYAEIPTATDPTVMRTHTIVLLIVLHLLAGCSQEPAVEQLLQRVEALEQAVEERKVDTAMDMLSDDFSTRKGQNRKDAHRLLLFHTLKHQTISVIRSQTEASLDPAYANQAQVRFNAIVTGGQGLLPEQGRSYAVDSRWTFDDGEWYLNSLDWEPLL